MKQRLLVMNGQRLVQSEQDGRWITDKVDKAGLVKPGIYNIYLAGDADKTKAHVGQIVHADKEFVYQQVGKSFVRHDRSNFDQMNGVGVNCSIDYDGDRAVVAGFAIKTSRSLSR